MKLLHDRTTQTRTALAERGVSTCVQDHKSSYVSEIHHRTAIEGGRDSVNKDV